MRKTILLSLFLALSINYLMAQNVSVLTQHVNNTRSGYNSRETKLNTSNVNSRQFGKAFSLTVDDQMYAQPLVVGNLLINKALHNVVFLATVNNSVYAYDGDNGTLYWQKNYTVAGQRPPMHTDMTGACGGSYADFSGNIGIVGTPVIDSAAQIMYFVARSTTNGTSFVQYLHAVNLIDGSEMTGSPVKIAATYAGNGPGNVNGVVSFDPQKNNQRQALTLANGIVYVTFSSHCDWQPYHGWILGYDKTSLTQKVVYNDSPNGNEAGLWESGGGPAVDASGNLFIVTGNGTVGYNNDQTNLINRGESALKLVPSGSTFTVASYYTPFNYTALEGSDLDYGSMGSFLIPNSNYYFTGCKDGNLYLLNKDNMGGYNQESNAVQQNIDLGSGMTLRCQPSYFKGVNTEFVYVWSENDLLRALPFNRTTNTFDVNNIVTSAIKGPTGSSGAELTVSSNNGAAGTGIVWAAYASNGDANQSTRPGILRAFDANNIGGTELWDNAQNSTRDNAGNFAKFASPTVANGHVYLPTFSNSVAVYGIIDTSSTAAVCSTVNLALNKPAFSSSNEASNYGPANAFDGNVSTRWSSMFSDPQWIYVDLGQVDSLCRVSLTWEGAIASNFQIQSSYDAQTWTTLATVTQNASRSTVNDVVGRGRYVRMLGTARATQYGYSIYEFQVNGKVLTGCITPVSLTSNNVTTTSAVLKWPPTGATSYIVKYGTSTSTIFKTVTTTADSVTVTGLTCATGYNWQVAAVCSGTTGTYSAQSTFSTLPCVGCGLLPTRVFTTDIGNLQVPGQACYTGVTSYNIKGSGYDIQNTADEFHYVYKTFSNDGIMQTKVTSQDQSNAWNKAGVMFRTSTDSTSANAFMGITSANGIAFQYRLAAGGGVSFLGQTGIQAPYFLRLVKQGNVYTGYSSPDSVNWTQLSTKTVSLNTNGPIDGGLVVCSHNRTALSTVQFDQAGFNLIGTTDANLALNKPSYGSTYTDNTHTGAFANDGNAATYWTSLANGNPQWYYVDLGQQFKLKRVDLLWNTSFGTTYQIQVSNDASTWTTVQQVTGNTIMANLIPITASARFVRVYGTVSSSTSRYSIDEMRVYGDTIATTSADVAKGKPVTSSSDASTANAAIYAVDGDFTTRWASGTTDPQWIYVDLGTNYNVTGVNITWELDVAKNFDVQVSSDKVNWATLKSVTNNAAYANFLTVSGNGRYVRINATAKGGPTDYSIFDLQVFGNPQLAPANSFNTVPVDNNTANFVVYPNPTTGQVSADFESKIVQDIQITVSDVSGNQLMKQSLSKFIGTYHYTANLSNLVQGNYIISLKTAKGVISRTVVKL